MDTGLVSLWGEVKIGNKTEYYFGIKPLCLWNTAGKTELQSSGHLGIGPSQPCFPREHSFQICQQGGAAPESEWFVLLCMKGSIPSASDLHEVSEEEPTV